MSAEMFDEELRYRIIESNEQILRRRLAAIDPSVLEKKYSNREQVCSIVYKRTQLKERLYHGVPSMVNDDCGFVDFYDEFHDRHIYVTRQVVGVSEAFHLEYDIQAIWNVISPNPDHQHSSYMSPQRQHWYINNILHVCLQMFDTEGNIAIFCCAGRSRSPMYLAAYLIMFCDMTHENAVTYVDRLLRQCRHQELDRHDTLYAFIVTIAEMVIVK